jgi:DNA-binding NarL/FixJ family response regulator
VAGGVRVVVADDNVDLRDMLRLSLELTDGIDVVGEAWDVASTLERVEDLEPDVLLVDLFMPGRGEELDVVDHAHRANPDMGIVVLTGWLVAGERDRVLARGASEYLVKSPDLMGAVVPALLTAVASRPGTDDER